VSHSVYKGNCIRLELGIDSSFEFWGANSTNYGIHNKVRGGHGMETIRGYADVIITMIEGAEGLYPTVTVIKCLQKMSHRGIVHLRTVK
jgi:hypothetical protein